MQNLTDFKNWLLLNCSSSYSAETHYKKLRIYFLHKQVFDKQNIEEFLISKKNWANTSFNIYLNALKWYAKFLKVEIEFPHFKRIHIHVRPYITLEELDNIIIHLPLIFRQGKKVRVVLHLMFESGVRPKELRQMKRADFDLDNKTVLIKNTKTFTDRKCALSDKLTKLLIEYFNEEAEEIHAFNINTVRLNYIFEKINECLNLKKRISAYTMRRSYAHYLISKGIKLTSLQLGMGHKNIDTTLGYLTVSQDEAQNEIRKILNKKKRG